MVNNDELEALRKRRMQQLQQQDNLFAQEDIQQQQQKQVEEQRQVVLRSVLSTTARERMGRIKVARPDIAASIENQLIMIAQSGQLKTKITDKQLTELLKRVIPKKRDITIRRK